MYKTIKIAGDPRQKLAMAVELVVGTYDCTMKGFSIDPLDPKTVRKSVPYYVYNAVYLRIV